MLLKQANLWEGRIRWFPSNNQWVGRGMGGGWPGEGCPWARACLIRVLIFSMSSEFSPILACLKIRSERTYELSSKWNEVYPTYVWVWTCPSKQIVVEQHRAKVKGWTIKIKSYQRYDNNYHIKSFLYEGSDLEEDFKMKGFTWLNWKIVCLTSL
jgi:hypothetical protein